MGMAQKIVAGNWKMNLSISEGETLAEALLSEDFDSEVQLIIAPPFTHLSRVADKIVGAHIALAAQNCHSESSGAYTGEIAATMLSEIGVQYVILGHSERRTLFNENSDFLNRKLLAVLNEKMKPIFCCGENLEEREKGTAQQVVSHQIRSAIFNLDKNQFQKCVVAYEPVWAIGTGKTATPDQAQDMHLFIRQLIEKQYGTAVAESTSILYGGSVKPVNAHEIFSQPDVDGALVGGASLKAADFAEIARSF